MDLHLLLVMSQNAIIIRFSLKIIIMGVFENSAQASQQPERKTVSDTYNNMIYGNACRDADKALNDQVKAGSIDESEHRVLKGIIDQQLYLIAEGLDASVSTDELKQNLKDQWNYIIDTHLKNKIASTEEVAKEEKSLSSRSSTVLCFVL